VFAEFLGDGRDGVELVAARPERDGLASAADGGERIADVV
jgi:hypothetical protein